MIEYNEARIDEICKQHEDEDAGKLLRILNDIVDEYRYLPVEALERVAENTDISLKVINTVVERGDMFSTIPVGDHVIVLCDGSVCHSRGAVEMLQALKFTLGIDPGETTSDNRFSLFVVSCVGCCEKAPVLMFDGVMLPEMKLAEVGKALEAIG